MRRARDRVVGLPLRIRAAAETEQRLRRRLEPVPGKFHIARRDEFKTVPADRFGTEVHEIAVMQRIDDRIVREQPVAAAGEEARDPVLEAVAGDDHAVVLIVRQDQHVGHAFCVFERDDSAETAVERDLQELALRLDRRDADLLRNAVLPGGSAQEPEPPPGSEVAQIPVLRFHIKRFPLRLHGRENIGVDVHEVVPDVPDDIAPDQTAEADVAHVDAVRRSRNETAGQRLDPAVDHKRPVAWRQRPESWQEKSKKTDNLVVQKTKKGDEHEKKNDPASHIDYYMQSRFTIYHKLLSATG